MGDAARCRVEKTTAAWFDERADCVKRPGAKRRGFLREKPLGAAAPKSSALPFTPTACGGVLWLFPIDGRLGGLMPSLVL